jgi:hypothetical protein
VESDLALFLSRAASEYGTRPSEMLGIPDPVTALAFDLALFQKSQMAKQAELEEIERQR